MRFVLAAAATAAAVFVPTAATAQPAPSPGRATQHVSHLGYDVTVPASWRVVDLH